MKRGVGLLQTTGGNFNSRGWTFSSDAATAIANEDFLLWGFSSVDAYDLTSLDIVYDRSNTRPTNVQIDIAVNGGAFTSLFTDTDVSSNSEVNSIDLSAFTAVTSAKFRLSGWNATTTLGTFDIEDDFDSNTSGGLLIRGDIVVAPVPVPTSLPIFGAALAGLALIRRRK